MSWGIAETASDIEKIKSKSADYLNGLNSCGVIDWDTYNYAFDFYMDLLIEAYKQGRKDAQSEHKNGQWIEHEWAEEYDGRLISNYECSECGSWKREETNYCPDCGARMGVWE